MSSKERWDRIWSDKDRLTSGAGGSFVSRDIIYRTVLGILRKEIPTLEGKRILEPGSGSGLVSLELGRLGADVYLLDISSEALVLAAKAFARAGTPHESVQASILDIPFGDDEFDITWNGGVVEHFSLDQQVRILNEMIRVTRPGGRVIVIVPSSNAPIYSKAKAYADRRSAWQPGYEEPMGTLENTIEQTRGSLVREYRTGFLAEFHFLKYYFTARPLRLAWAGLVELLSYPLGFLNRRPGYLLVSVIEKPGDTF
jgi:SAM-dependent methyltransferase